jgi:uncharacterized delta-60 repeat protein
MRYVPYSLWLFLILVTFGAMTPGSTKAQSPDSLDPTFEGDGLVTTNLLDKNDVEIQALSLQPDGKIRVAGSAISGNSSDFALIRYKTDGSLDPTFDGDGKVTTDINSSSYDVAWSLILQTDGKIVVAGSSEHYFALARYNPNGSLDSTFDGDGKMTNLVGATGGAVALVLQGDGKFVVAGYAFNGNDYDFALIRYNTNGSLDSTFDGDGKVLTNFSSGSTEEAYDLALQLDGKIVVTGSSYDSK